MTGKALGLSQPTQITIAVLASTALVIAVVADVLPAPLHRLFCAGWPRRIGRLVWAERWQRVVQVSLDRGEVSVAVIPPGR